MSSSLHNQRPRWRTRACAAACLCLLAGGALAQQQNLYRWVDEDGVVHYGDRVPPEYAGRDRDLLNDQGVTVGSERGAVSEEERAATSRREAAEKAAERARRESVQRDRMLLETYLTVADIEDLRDRRLELLESQIKVTELYLSNLHNRLASLEREAAAYRPYSDDPNAKAVPRGLASEISQTKSSIAAYEATLTRTTRVREELRSEFDADIARFRELKDG